MYRIVISLRLEGWMDGDMGSGSNGYLLLLLLPMVLLLLLSPLLLSLQLMLL